MEERTPVSYQCLLSGNARIRLFLVFSSLGPQLRDYLPNILSKVSFNGLSLIQLVPHITLFISITSNCQICGRFFFFNLF